eukprot:COSAG01_NODE_5853_length_3992_cov_8.064475_3_plen_67_part_00
MTNPTLCPRSRTLNASKTEARIFIGIEPVSFTGEKLAFCSRYSTMSRKLVYLLRHIIKRTGSQNRK